MRLKVWTGSDEILELRQGSPDAGRRHVNCVKGWLHRMAQALQLVEARPVLLRSQHGPRHQLQQHAAPSTCVAHGEVGLKMQAVGGISESPRQSMSEKGSMVP